MTSVTDAAKNHVRRTVKRDYEIAAAKVCNCPGAVKSFATVVMLLPARTDTKWFHDWCLPYGKNEFLRGRLKFGGCCNFAPFPSMIVIFEVEKDA